MKKGFEKFVQTYLMARILMHEKHYYEKKDMISTKRKEKVGIGFLCLLFSILFNELWSTLSFHFDLFHPYHSSFFFLLEWKLPKIYFASRWAGALVKVLWLTISV